MVTTDQRALADDLKRRAAAFHARGFNCAQSVVCAIAPELDVDENAAFRLAEGFGLGMGGMSETCGALSGAIMALGQLSSRGPDDPTTKAATYQLARTAAQRFRELNGSTLCHELKGIGTHTGPLRDCPGCIEDAVEIAVELIDARESDEDAG